MKREYYKYEVDYTLDGVKGKTTVLVKETVGDKRSEHAFKWAVYKKVRLDVIINHYKLLGTEILEYEEEL